MSDAENGERFTSVHDLSLETLVQRFGPTAGIDKFRILQFEQRSSSTMERRRLRLEAIQQIVRDSATALPQ